MNPILFYSTQDEYGWMSNFFASPIVVDGREWPTTEHYFQAQKFVGTPSEEEIRLARSPMVAARMGRARSRPLRRDWEGVKDGVMQDALRAKFSQHPGLKAKLLATADARLVEHTKNDRYWADGGDGTGRNRLGELLMELREELRRP
jgi:N-glycosidase YbiA